MRQIESGFPGSIHTPDFPRKFGLGARPVSAAARLLIDEAVIDAVTR